MLGRSFAILLTFALMGASAAHAQNARPISDAANGKRIYIADGCALCHGAVGQGGRGTGPHIAPSPLPFEAFAEQVRRPANTMPPYTTVVLSDQDLGDIHAYLLTIPPLLDPQMATILEH
jgi:mono/diheme cytochrome c family protein